jgi:hypothetical protein
MQAYWQIAACLVAVTPTLVAAQPGPKTSEQVKKDVEQTQAIKTQIDAAQAKDSPRFVRTLTNVQIELTLTDQIGTNPAEKKTVSMIASSGSWGKIRSAGNSRPAGETPVIVQLDVDARPFVSVDGPIQLELTVNYSPPGAQTPDTDNARARRTSINQSLTVVLQSGKPLVISQAADPVNDRKVLVEVKATVLK